MWKRRGLPFIAIATVCAIAVAALILRSMMPNSSDPRQMADSRGPVYLTAGSAPIGSDGISTPAVVLGAGLFFLFVLRHATRARRA